MKRHMIEMRYTKYFKIEDYGQANDASEGSFTAALSATDFETVSVVYEFNPCHICFAE